MSEKVEINFFGELLAKDRLQLHCPKTNSCYGVAVYYYHSWQCCIT